MRRIRLAGRRVSICFLSRFLATWVVNWSAAGKAHLQDDLNHDAPCSKVWAATALDSWTPGLGLKKKIQVPMTAL